MVAVGIGAVALISAAGTGAVALRPTALLAEGEAGPNRSRLAGQWWLRVQGRVDLHGFARSR
jgi:hypothetical protein